MIKNRKSIIYVVLILALSLTLVACGSKDGDGSNGGGNSGGEVKGLAEAFAEQPILLTSVGQSADVEMIKALMDNAGLDYKIQKLATADDLGDAKTLVLAVGGSSKGLGAAGIDADQELARNVKLIEDAKAKDIKIIAMHIGGESRRGELSDKFIGPSAENSDYIIIVEDGNKDGMFTNIASSNDIPMEVVTSISEAIEPLKKAFK